MKTKGYIWAAVAVFIFIILYEWLVHGMLLSHIYAQTANVWRLFRGADAFWLRHISQLLIALWVTYGFSRYYKNRDIASGVPFGLFIGVFRGLLAATWYLWLPIPVILAVYWFVAALIEGLGIGYILGLVWKKARS